jgi:hypothetical protein
MIIKKTKYSGLDLFPKKERKLDLETNYDRAAEINLDNKIRKSGSDLKQ